MPSMQELLSLLGHSLAAPCVKAFRKKHPLKRSGAADPVDPRFFSNKTEGYCLLYEQPHRKTPLTISTIFLYLHPREGYTPFSGELLRGLHRADTVTQVRQRWSEPTRSGFPSTPWDRYDDSQLCIHLSYPEQEHQIRMITLMSPNTAP